MISTSDQQIIKRLIKNFAENNINAFFVADKAAALDKVREIVSGQNSIAFAGSQTVIEIGARDYFLKNGDKYKIIDPYEKGISKEESFERRRQSLLADVLITGSNAITRDGHIVNMDNQGNRVAGIGFGPKKVVIVAGMNKIVNNLSEARRRIATIAAPLNNRRLKTGNPCEKSGKCKNCKLPTRICRIYSVIDGQAAPGRLHVIIVGGNFGF